MSYSFDYLHRKVMCSIDMLIEFDHFLLKEKANERSVTHKLAEYLQQEFKDWNVDCEYNRMVNGESNDPKRIKLPVENIKSNDTEAKTVFPDIIIHKREKRDNLLVIEVKKHDNRANLEFDVLKLKKFTSEELSYDYGLQLIFHTGPDYKKQPESNWYKDGIYFEV